MNQKGPGKLFLLLTTLQKECDRQSRKIFEHFKTHRDYQAKVKTVTLSYTNSFMLQNIVLWELLRKEIPTKFS